MLVALYEGPHARGPVCSCPCTSDPQRPSKPVGCRWGVVGVPLGCRWGVEAPNMGLDRGRDAECRTGTLTEGRTQVNGDSHTDALHPVEGWAE